MTNPANAIKVLITYAVCIPLAIVVGYMLTDPFDYGTLGIFGLIALILLSPVFIKWHYPLLLLSLSSPIYCFFLKGSPPLWQVMVLLSLGIAIIERTLNSDKRFISPPVMVWPLVFTVVMAYTTAKLTGGIGLKALGGGVDGGVGGGKKYIELFLGIALFFALTSRTIPKERRNLYLGLYFLGGLPAFIGDLFPILPSPLNYINYLIPPTSYLPGADFSLASRLGAFGTSASVIFNYMLARHGLRGIFLGNRPLRMIFFLFIFCLALMGGFRIALVTNVFLMVLLFFLEGLHRTRLLLICIMLGIIGTGLLIPFSRDLPSSIQRTLTVLPLKLDPDIVADAEGSKQWRLDMWQDLWPKVPQYLLVGKGYALTAEDFELIGNGQFAGGADAALDKSKIGLAVSGDYHNGPLSTLIPFGVWGAISILWLLAAALFITYRNFRYSEPELRAANAYFLTVSVWHIVCFFFVFGGYSGDVQGLCRTVGFSIALNWGIRKRAPRPAAQPALAPQSKRLLRPRPLPA